MDFAAPMFKTLLRDLFFPIADRGSWIPGSSSFAEASEDGASRRCRDLSEDDERSEGDDEKKDGFPLSSYAEASEDGALE